MQKLYYSISEISKIIDEPPHTLRNWEKEFPMLKPKKNRSGNRIYSEKDLNTLREIRRLCRDEKLSLKKVKKILEEDISYNNSIIHPVPAESNTDKVEKNSEKKRSNAKTQEKTIEKIIQEKEENKLAKEETKLNNPTDEKSLNEELKAFLLTILEKVKKL